MKETQTNTWMQIGIQQGLNRQIRRMGEAIGHPVRRLVRTRIGPLTDPRLPPGEWRTLDRAEVRALEVASAQETQKTKKSGPTAGADG